MKSGRIWSILAVFAVLVIVILCVPIKSVTINPADEFRLSENAVKRLEVRVLEENDARAAYRLALYYERVKKDDKAFIRWLQIADHLGEPSAKDTMKRLAPYLKDGKYAP